MPPDQLHPLVLNPKTREPFLRLHRHPKIILTPLRWDDAHALVPLMNDPRVYEGLSSPTLPYLLSRAIMHPTWLTFISEEDAEDALRGLKTKQDALLETILAAQGAEALTLIDGCPVGAIREVVVDDLNEFGEEGRYEDVFIGNVWIGRHPYGEVTGEGESISLNKEDKVRWVTENAERKVGDANILWSIGDFLASSHHGQGIMTDAVETLITEWGAPRMGIRKIQVGIFVGNSASVRVFEKIGFKQRGILPNYQIVRGETKSVHVLDWKLDDGETIAER